MIRASSDNRRISQEKADRLDKDIEKERKEAERQAFLNSLKVKVINHETGKEEVGTEYDPKKLPETMLRQEIQFKIIDLLSEYRKRVNNGEEVPSKEEKKEEIKEKLKEIYGKNKNFGKLEVYLGGWIEHQINKFEQAEKGKLPNRPGYDIKRNFYINKNDGEEQEK